MTRPWQAPPDVLARVAQRLLRTLVAPAIPYLPLLANGHTVGWLTPQRASRIAAWASLFRVNNDAVELVGDAGATAMTTSLDEIARTLSREGALSAWRDERYAVRDPVQGGVLFEVERAAARYLGIHTRAAHINGVVRVDERWRMWLARRSVVKAIDPGLLDNLVGGGIAAGMTVASTLIKEAWEEAGISAGLAAEAIPVGAVQICRDQPDGLHRETIYTHDLWLAGEFFPNNQDGEAQY